MLLSKMIKKSIISITNIKQRHKCISWALTPHPKEREKDRMKGIKGSCIHLNHPPVRENESVRIQLTIKCIANINDMVPIIF